MEGRKGKRKRLRLPASPLVRCYQADIEKFGGRAINLSTGGVGIMTNSPIKSGEQFKLEFFLKDTINPIYTSAELVWSQVNYDNTTDSAESIFTAGIRFLEVKRSFRGLILDYLLKHYWKEYLFGPLEIKKLLLDLQNLPLEERRIVLHNYQFCLLFAERRCPHQEIVERAYLIPQVLTTNDLTECQNTCWNCQVYTER
jgi:hypothetical protein